MRFKTVSRGKLSQLTTSSGEPVDMRIYGCVVTKGPYVRNNKRYMRLNLDGAVGDTDVLKAVDDHVRKVAASAFSPVGDDVIVKMARTAYETEDANPGFRFEPEPGLVVDVELRPGAFGKFGYCLLLRRIKPHALSP